jgi:hypothetical protein
MALVLELNELPEVLKFLDEFVNRVNLIQDRLRSDLKVRVEDDNRFFGLGQREAVLAHELLTFCLPKWSSLLRRVTPEMIEQARGEVYDRIRSILAYQFISTMSLIEFGAKESIKTASSSSLAAATASTKGRLSLRLIVNESRRLNLISENDLDTWSALIEIRNMLVHNNGRADKSVTYKIAGLTVALVPGKMTEADTFLFFPKITAEAVDKYHDWLRILFDVHQDRGTSS